MKLIGLLLLSLVSFLSWSQAPTMDGVWEGYSTFAKDTFEVKYIIHQEGKLLTGTGQIIHPKDSAKYYFNGTLTKNKAELRATKFIYKTNVLTCLPKIKLQWEGSELSGKWGYNPVWGGCLPGVSGRTFLVKKQEDAPIVGAASNPTATDQVVVDDMEGSTLVKALKTRKYYALIVAINDYPDPDIAQLGNPIKDAEQMIETLEQHYTFEKSTISFLKNPTRAQLIEAFDELADKVEEKDNLLIFYAGHGIWDQKLKQGFWLPTDASLSSKAQWLSNSTIRDYIRGIESKHTLLIADACFGGSILKERAVFMNSKAMFEMYKRPSRKAMTSGALKTVPDESVFIKYLVQGLKNNPYPLMSAEQLFGDFKVAVINNSITGQVPQYGAITLAGDEGGDFIFLKRD